MKEARPDRYHHGDLRRALVASAVAFVEHEGVDRLTLRKVAERAKVTHAAVYAHFEDKEDLIAAAKAEGFRRLNAELGAAIADAPADPFERLRVLGEEYFRFAIESAALFQLMFRRPLRAAKPHAEHVAIGKETFEVLRATFGECCKDRRARPGLDPERTALVGWCMVHGLASLWVDGPLRHVAPPKATLDTLARDLVPAFLALVKN